jgi:cathepsin D
VRQSLRPPSLAILLTFRNVRSDLWVADKDCIAGCQNVPTFNEEGSSTFNSTDRKFQIVYGSGRASGFLGQDKVAMAGFVVEGQTFGMHSSLCCCCSR